MISNSSHGNRKTEELAEILVAAQDIPAGIFINPKMVVKTQLPVSLESSYNINDLQEVDGLTTVIFIPKGKPIVYTQFAPSEKAQAPVRGHNPQNYTFAVNEETGVGKLFKPGTNFYFFGKASERTEEIPSLVFKKVELVYQVYQPLKSFGYAQNSIRLFTITPAQVELLKSLAGRPLKLLLKGTNGEEIVDISQAGD